MWKISGENKRKCYSYICTCAKRKRGKSDFSSRSRVDTVKVLSKLAECSLRSHPSRRSVFYKISIYIFVHCGRAAHARRAPFINSSYEIQRDSNPEFERNRTKIADLSEDKLKRFHALRAHAKRATFRISLFGIQRGFQSRIWAKSDQNCRFFTK